MLAHHLHLTMQFVQLHIFEFFGGFLCSLSCIEVTTFEMPKPTCLRILQWGCSP